MQAAGSCREITRTTDFPSSLGKRLGAAAFIRFASIATLAAMNRVCHSYWPAFTGSPHDEGCLGHRRSPGLFRRAECVPLCSLPRPRWRRAAKRLRGLIARSDQANPPSVPLIAPLRPMMHFLLRTPDTILLRFDIAPRGHGRGAGRRARPTRRAATRNPIPK
jgi:hypothetical protein